MIMKRFYYTLIGTIILFWGCTSNTTPELSVYDEEAQEIADSLRNIDTLIAYANKYKGLDEKRAEVIIRETLGKLYRDRSDFANAITQHDSAIAIARSISDTLHLIRALNQQGTNFRRMGDMEEASKLHYQALELCDAQKEDTTYVSRKNRVVSLNGLGNVLLSMGNYDEAEHMFRQAFAGEHSLGSALGQAINLANIGSIFEHNGRYDSARVYYNRSMEMNREAKNATGIGLCYQYLGHLDEHEKNLPSAEQNFLTSYKTLVETGDSWHWLEASIALSRLYIFANNADSARKYVGITTRTAEEIASMEHRATAYNLYSQVEERWGSPSKALALFRLSTQLNDSVLSEKNYNHIQNLRVNYETKRRTAEIEQAKEEAKTEQKMRRITTWIGITILLFLGGIVVALMYINDVRKRSYRTLQEANEAIKLADEELRKADSELRQADEELRKADRERQAFYRDIAHRFRTPLTVVIGMTQQLRAHISSDDEQGQGDFKAVERQNAELLRLVNEMMHKLQPNATTATVTAIDGELTFGNIADAYEGEENLVNTGKDEEAKAQPNADGTKPLILLAEDNEDVARYQCELLERNGYRVNWAVNGVMALELIAEEMPKLVITDVMMPRMNGLELCRQIRGKAETSHLPLIVVTARVEDRDRMKGLEAGAEVYLTKPFLGKELLLNIKNLLEQREKLRQKFTDEFVVSGLSVAESINTLDQMQKAEEAENAKADNDVETASGAEEVTDADGAKNEEFRMMVNEVIDSNLGDPNFSSTILAAHMCLSRAQLNRKINSELGTDTSHYIRERRLEHACRMLRSSDMSIMDIQVACGFDSPAYFSRAFKQRFEKSPSEWRKGS